MTPERATRTAAQEQSQNRPAVVVHRFHSPYEYYDTLSSQKSSERTVLEPTVRDGPY